MATPLGGVTCGEFCWRLGAWRRRRRSGIVAAITAGRVVFASELRAARRPGARTRLRVADGMGPSGPGGDPFHSDFYRGYAERRGWDPCVTWAQDQRNSAIRGLRELGYTVTEPEGGAPPPGPAPTASVSHHVPLVVPDLYSADGRARRALLAWRSLSTTRAKIFARTHPLGRMGPTWADAPVPLGLLPRLCRAAWLGPVRHLGAGPAQLGHSRPA